MGARPNDDNDVAYPGNPSLRLARAKALLVAESTLSQTQAHILVLAYPKGLAWVLSENRMGWQANSAHVGQRIGCDDRLYLYASRAAAPTLSGAIIGVARALGRVRAFDVPEAVGGRVLTHGLPLEVETLVEPDAATALSVLAPQLPTLDYHRNTRAWTGHLQRGVVPIEATDESVLKRVIVPASDFAKTREAYIRLALAAK